MSSENRPRATLDSVGLRPFGEAIDGLSGIAGLESELNRHIDGEEPATIHAALG